MEYPNQERMTQRRFLKNSKTSNSQLALENKAIEEISGKQSLIVNQLSDFGTLVLQKGEIPDKIEGKKSVSIQVDVPSRNNKSNKLRKMKTTFEYSELQKKKEKNTEKQNKRDVINNTSNTGRNTWFKICKSQERKKPNKLLCKTLATVDLSSVINSHIAQTEENILENNIYGGFGRRNSSIPSHIIPHIRKRSTQIPPKEQKTHQISYDLEGALGIDKYSGEGPQELRRYSNELTRRLRHLIAPLNRKDLKEHVSGLKSMEEGMKWEGRRGHDVVRKYLGYLDKKLGLIRKNDMGHSILQALMDNREIVAVRHKRRSSTSKLGIFSKGNTQEIIIPNTSESHISHPIYKSGRMSSMEKTLNGTLIIDSITPPTQVPADVEHSKYTGNKKLEKEISFSSASKHFEGIRDEGNNGGLKISMFGPKIIPNSNIKFLRKCVMPASQVSTVCATHNSNYSGGEIMEDNNTNNESSAKHPKYYSKHTTISSGKVKENNLKENKSAGQSLDNIRRSKSLVPSFIPSRNIGLVSTQTQQDKYKGRAKLLNIYNKIVGEYRPNTTISYVKEQHNK